MPLAMVSPTGKLMVEVVGAGSKVGVADTKPAPVCEATVRFPVTATADAGTPQWSWTVRVWGTPVANAPVTPDRTAVGRLSMIRDGLSGTNFRPPTPGSK